MDIFQFLTCFIEKVCGFWKNKSPRRNKKLDNSYFNFISGQFLLGRRGRKTKNKKMLA